MREHFLPNINKMSFATMVATRFSCIIIANLFVSFDGHRSAR